MNRIFSLAASVLILLTSCQSAVSSFVRVENGKFVSDDYPSHFLGTNFWYGPILASEGQGGDRERLAKELDLLKENGMTNRSCRFCGYRRRKITSRLFAMPP